MADKIIDLSYYNNITDWAKLKKSVDGVIIRAGYRGYGSCGTLVEDTRFKEFTNACVKNKIPFGFYFFSQAVSEKEARAEANFVIGLIKNYKPLFPIYFDSEMSTAGNKEGRADKISKAVRTACTVAFCKVINTNGYKPGVYASETWFSNNLDFSQIKKYSIWVAKYSKTKPTTKTYDAWQYTESGSVSGINGKVDISYFYKSFIPSPPEITLNKTYTLTNVRGVYNGVGASTGRKKIKDLTASGKANATSDKKNDEAYLEANSKVTIFETKLADSGNLWARIPSGWICIWERDIDKLFIK